MTPQKAIMIIVLSLVLFVILIFAIIGLISYILVIMHRKAFTYTLANPLHCGTNICPATVNPDLTLDEKFIVDPSKYQKEIAIICLDLNVRIAFNKGTQVTLKGIGWPVLQIFNTLDSSQQFGQIWMNDKYIWIVLRGTTDKSLSEWVADLSISQVSAALNKNNLKLPNFVDQNPNIMIHSGFCEIWGQVQQKIVDFVSLNGENKTVILCGHSLGAAVATLLALQLHTDNYNVLLYTTASPRVGNNDFVSFVKDTKLNIYSQVNTEDLIPNMPLSVALNTKQPENPYFYAMTTKAMTFTSNWLSIINNHTIGNYQENVIE